MSYFTNVKTREQDTLDLDAFGRKRMSSTAQRFDVEFIYNKQPLIVDEVTATGGTVTHNANSRDLTLAINNTTTGTKAEMYSHYDIPYTAGNSQLIEITGALNNSNIANGNVEIFLRSSISGTPVTTTYAQNTWNRNTVSDTDWTFSQIFFMDFQSLKVGRIRFALVKNGTPVLVHEIHNDNIRASGYWQTPNLPLSWRIYNDATNTYCEIGYGDENNGIGFRFVVTKNASATLRAICGTVKSEGGQDLLDMAGYPFAISNRTTPITVSTTLIPILSIRLKSTFNSITNRGLIIPLGFSLETDNPVNYRIFYRPTLNTPSWQSVDDESLVEYDVSSTTVTGGFIVEDDIVSTSRNVPIGEASLLGRTILSQGRTGVSDILTICAIRVSTTNATVVASLKWKEIR